MVVQLRRAAGENSKRGVKYMLNSLQCFNSHILPYRSCTDTCLFSTVLPVPRDFRVQGCSAMAFLHQAGSSAWPRARTSGDPHGTRPHLLCQQQAQRPLAFFNPKYPSDFPALSHHLALASGGVQLRFRQCWMQIKEEAENASPSSHRQAHGDPGLRRSGAGFIPACLT